ncbi:MAG: hypothetical protein ABEJ56_03445 [Candidatus Nanohaloarchaea archaeon]
MSEIKRKNYKSLSKSEYKLVEFVLENELKVFTRADMEKNLGFDTENCYRIISGLRKKDMLESPIRGYYVLDIPNYNVSLYQVATRIYWPSYISFWTALSYHSLTDQLPRTVYVVNAENSSEIEFRDHRIDFVRFKPEYIFGYEDSNGFIADPEKAVIDSLHLPRYSGGITEVEKALERDLNIQKLEEYAENMGISAVKKRLKYLMQRKAIDNSLEVSGSYVKLDPSKGDGKRIKNCLIEDNVYKGRE